MAVNKTINKRTNTHGAMRNCIEYVLRQDKTSEQLTYMTGPYCHDAINYDLVYQTFLEERNYGIKTLEGCTPTILFSWHKDEQIILEQAFEFGKEFAEKWFQGFQTLVAVHKDKDHIHCHLVTNSVSYEDGKKLHTTKKRSGADEAVYQPDVPGTWADGCRKRKTFLMAVRLKRAKSLHGARINIICSGNK